MKKRTATFLESAVQVDDPFELGPLAKKIKQSANKVVLVDPAIKDYKDNNLTKLCGDSLYLDMANSAKEDAIAGIVNDLSQLSNEDIENIVDKIYQKKSMNNRTTPGGPK